MRGPPGTRAGAERRARDRSRSVATHRSGRGSTSSVGTSTWPPVAAKAALSRAWCSSQIGGQLARSGRERTAPQVEAVAERFGDTLESEVGEERAHLAHGCLPVVLGAAAAPPGPVDWAHSRLAVGGALRVALRRPPPAPGPGRSPACGRPRRWPASWRRRCRAPAAGPRRSRSSVARVTWPRWTSSSRCPRTVLGCSPSSRGHLGGRRPAGRSARRPRARHRVGARVYGPDSHGHLLPWPRRPGACSRSCFGCPQFSVATPCYA